MSEATPMPTAPEALPLRDGAITIARLIDLYMAHYDGRDTTRVQRLTWWREKLGTLRLQDVSDDHLHVALEALAAQPTRYYAGKDVEGRAIYKPKGRPLAPATINRYAVAISAVFTWANSRATVLAPLWSASNVSTADDPPPRRWAGLSDPRAQDRLRGVVCTDGRVLGPRFVPEAQVAAATLLWLHEASPFETSVVYLRRRLR